MSEKHKLLLWCTVYIHFCSHCHHRKLQEAEVFLKKGLKECVSRWWNRHIYFSFSKVLWS